MVYRRCAHRPPLYYTLADSVHTLYAMGHMKIVAATSVVLVHCSCLVYQAVEGSGPKITHRPDATAVCFERVQASRTGCVLTI
ncbi:hypothetical protein AAHC03_024162 [Spirometra sp. Aus1]